MFNLKNLEDQKVRIMRFLTTLMFCSVGLKMYGMFALKEEETCNSLQKNATNP